MDYERKYKSAVERAKYALTTDMDNSGHWACTYIFPELKEMSEKEIMQYLVEECESIVANSDFTDQERTAKAEKSIDWLKNMLSDDGVIHEVNDTDKSTPREEEMVVSILKELVSNWKRKTKLLPKYTSDEGTIDEILQWLETRETHTKNSSLAEKEKDEFVSGNFLYCRESLDAGLTKGEKYWLEYVGDDIYVGRSDNILGMSFHITPGQLYRCFTQQPPCEQRADDGVENNSPSAYGKYVDGCLNDAVDRYFSDERDSYTIADVFYAGLRCGKNYISRCENDTTETNDITGVWIARNNGLSEPVFVVDTKDNAYVVEQQNGDTLLLKVDYVHDNFHRWTIDDAHDGDILISGLSGFPFIFSHANKDGIFAHGGINTMGDFDMLEDANMLRWTRKVKCPANHEQRETLLRKMAEKGYKFSEDSKTIVHQ